MNYTNPFSSESSKIHFVDPTSNKLTTHEAKYLKVMNNSLQDGFIAATLHPNHSNPKNSYSPVNGAVFTYEGSAPANPKLFGNFFTHKLVASIKNDRKFTDEYFQKRMDKIKEIPRTSDDSISLDLLSGNNVVDGDEWEATLGENGRIRVVLAEGDFGKVFYKIEVQTDAGRAGEELKQFLAQSFETENPITMGEFYDSAEYKKVKDLSERNARRILHLTATALGVNLVSPPEDDINALVKDERFALPLLATPEVHNRGDHLARLYQNGKSVIVYYHGLTDAKRSKGGLVQESSPISPIRIYMQPSSIDKEYSYSFSPHTPINANFMDEIDPNGINEDLADYINNTVTWDGKEKNNPYHPKVLGKYTNFNQKTDYINENMLGINEGYFEYKPVVSYIKSPHI